MTTRATAERLVAVIAASAALLLVSYGNIPVRGFDGDHGSPARNLTYDIDDYWTNWDPAFDDRMDDAADEWSDRAPGSITFSSGSSNIVTQKALGSDGALAKADLSCGGSNCDFFWNSWRYACDEYYHGTGSTAPQSDPPWPACGPPITQHDLWGIAVHELGHWRGLGHDAAGYSCDGSDDRRLYAPDPTNEMMSMCYVLSEPAVEGGTGSAGIAPRRTITQDEIQGVLDYQDGHFVANYSFEECPGCAWDDTPTYWWFTPDSNHYWGSGTETIISLNDNPTVPYPEVVQRVQGAEADGDNDGRFRAKARVKAIAEDARAVVFVRHWHDTYSNHEESCTDWNLEVGVWTVIDCNYLDLVNSTAYEFEYGVRVTDKIDIDWITVEDL